MIDAILQNQVLRLTVLDYKTTAIRNLAAEEATITNP